MRTNSIGEHCDHDYKITKEYNARGKNILGKVVKARMAKVECQKCMEDNVQFIKAL